MFFEATNYNTCQQIFIAIGHNVLWQFRIGKSNLGDNLNAHFRTVLEDIFDQIPSKCMILTATSEGHISSPRWSWMMFKHTGTMYSSRYVDSRPLKCSLTKLGASNRARKLTGFGQNPDLEHAPPYVCVCVCNFV